MTSQSGVKGSTLICSTLERLGVECLFGLPGSQNVDLFEALRRSSIRTVLATHELAASFMANGYYRSSGKVGVVTTIPGPGFTYALTGLAEAFLDSAAVLCLSGKSATSPGRRFQLQAIDQQSMAAPVVKKIFSIHTLADVSPTLAEAYDFALQGEPGPVFVEISESVFSEVGAGPLLRPAASPHLSETPDPRKIDEIIQLLKQSKRAAFYVGAGAFQASHTLQKLVERLGAPVLTTTSGRGVLPETHPLVLSTDSGLGEPDSLNRFVESCDLVLALGCKFSHNGAHGFRLQIPPQKLIHVDASEAVPGSNYPTRWSLVSDVSIFLDQFAQRVAQLHDLRPSWSDEELKSWRGQIRMELLADSVEPVFPEIEPSTATSFFAALREVLPARSSLVTDSGLHQMLTRKHFNVLSPRGLITPTNFQSMGFGLPAAIGASLASSHHPVVALIGDGAFAMSGMELLTAVREKIPLTVIVFNDGKLGLIRLSQLRDYGRSHATELKNPDFSIFTKSLGANYVRLKGDPKPALQHCLQSKGVSLAEVRLEDSSEISRMQVKSLMRETARDIVGPKTIERLKDWRKRKNRD